MKVNEIKQTKEVVVSTEYIANDGKIFRTKEECEQWEKTYECTLGLSMKKIPHIETNGEDAYVQCGNCDDEVWIVKPRDFEDIKVINAYTEVSCCGCKADLTQDDIGKTIILNFGYNHDWCDVIRVEPYLKNITKKFEEYESKLRGNENVRN